MTTTAKNLADLFAQMKLRSLDSEDWTSLPTFGGHEPLDTAGIWSWDATHVLTGTCADDLAIERREDVNIDTHGHTAADAHY